MKNKIQLLSIFCILLLFQSLKAQVPENYYSSANGYADAQLKDALHLILKNHVTLSYSSLPEHFKSTDWHPDGYYWDMYSSNKRTSYSGMNREHSFPKSWWGGIKNAAYSDILHLYPTDISANSARSNFPLGEVGKTSWDNNVIKVGTNTYPDGYRGTVFEPADEYKGDIARTFFYMVTCYQDYQWKNNAVNMLNQNTYPVFQDWAIKMLLEWHRQDPVSQKETDRNNAVYKVQKNRNPFIDYPELAEYIWGNNVGETFDFSNPGGDPDMPRVTIDNKNIQFKLENLGEENIQYVTVKGANLTENVSISLSGSSMFSTEVTSISKEELSSSEGFKLPVLYKPSAYGTHTATIEITGGGLDKSVEISLEGVLEAFEGVIYEASFASGIGDFNAVNVLGNENWEYNKDYKCMNISGYVSANKNNANEDWLVSASFDLSKISKATLSYNYTISKGRGNTVTEDYMKTHQTVWITDNYTGNPSTTNWTQLTNTIYPTGKDWNYVNESISLPQNICGSSKVVVAFKYVCDTDDSATWQINNLTITGATLLGVENDKIKDNIRVYTTPGYLNVELEDNSDANLNLEVYNIVGEILAKEKINSNSISIPVAKGQILIVKAGNKISKVITH